MAKIPDFSGLAKNLNIQGIVDSMKSVINPAGAAIINPPTDDELGIRFAETYAMLQELANTNAQQAKAITAITGKLEVLYKDMLMIRKATVTNTVVGQADNLHTPGATMQNKQDD